MDGSSSRCSRRDRCGIASFACSVPPSLGSDRRCAMARFPMPPYPNSWYHVAWSDEVVAGRITRLFFLGREMIAFRGHGGTVHVLDAYCPHMGTHLGVGGCVV